MLFESLAREMGAATIAALLTGMGRDGATGLLAIRRAGGATIAQDEATSVVYGMPREAALLGAAEQILPLQEIGPAIARAAAAPDRRGDDGGDDVIHVMDMSGTPPQPQRPPASRRGAAGRGADRRRQPDRAHGSGRGVPVGGACGPSPAPTSPRRARRWRAEPIAVAVLDVLLPDGDGLDLLRAIRSAPATADLPVLMLSTEAEVRDRIRGLQRGADDYVGKPYDRAHVVSRARALARRHDAAPAPSARHRAGDRRQPHLPRGAARARSTPPATTVIARRERRGGAAAGAATTARARSSSTASCPASTAPR